MEIRRGEGGGGGGVQYFLLTTKGKRTGQCIKRDKHTMHFVGGAGAGLVT